MSTPEFEIVEAKADTPINVDVEAVSAGLRAEQQQTAVTASTQVHGDDVAGA